jgi:hypothetical protein
MPQLLVVAVGLALTALLATRGTAADTNQDVAPGLGIMRAIRSKAPRPRK